MTVLFHSDFDYRETDFKTIAYLAGYLGEVDATCGRLAVFAGAAEYIPDTDQTDEAE